MAPRPPPKRSGLDKKRPGLDDMTLLTKPTPQGIRDNLKERLEAECIYTYIGNVLVAANPFTWPSIPIYVMPGGRTTEMTHQLYPVPQT